MERFNLQLFAEAVKGKKLAYLYRIYKEGESKTAQAIAFTTENSRSISKDADTTATKDGSIRTPGEAEIEVSVTSMLAKDNTFIDDLEQAMLDDERMEVWEVNLESPVTNATKQYKGKYYQGYITSFETTSAADGFVEVSLTFGLIGTGKTGNVTVTDDQEAAIDYTFQDTTVRTSGES